MEENVFNPEPGDSKIPKIKGVRFVYCQHLKEGMQGREDVLQWAGDKLRFVLCPICARIMSDTGMQRATLLFTEMSAYQAQKERTLLADLKATEKQIQLLQAKLDELEPHKIGTVDRIKAWFAKARSGGA